MKCTAPKPIFFTEDDWAPIQSIHKRNKKHISKDYSFSEKDVEKGTVKEIPDNDFTKGLVKEGLLNLYTGKEKPKDDEKENPVDKPNEDSKITTSKGG